jgi:hypothetical protein
VIASSVGDFLVTSADAPSRDQTVTNHDQDEIRVGRC